MKPSSIYANNVRRRGRLQRIAVAIVAITCAAVVGLIVVVVAIRRDTLPEVTFAILAEAERRWHQSGPSDYDLQVKLSGIMSGVAEICVRQNEVTTMTLNGRETKPHTWDEWTVPAMFSIIRRDLEACAQASGKLAPVFARGEFDAKLGYPTQYRRVTPTGMDAEWQISLTPK